MSEHHPDPSSLTGHHTPRHPRDYRTRLQRNRHLWQSWGAEIPTLTQHFMQWKHGVPPASDTSGSADTLNPETGDIAHVFDVAVVSTFSESYLLGHNVRLITPFF